MHLTAEFVEKVHRIFSYRGREWLPELPSIVAQCRDKWCLREGVVCSLVSPSYIEFTTTVSGEAVVLKAGVPYEELFTEMEALRIYYGRGACACWMQQSTFA